MKNFYYIGASKTGKTQNAVNFTKANNLSFKPFIISQNFNTFHDMTLDEVFDIHDKLMGQLIDKSYSHSNTVFDRSPIDPLAYFMYYTRNSTSPRKKHLIDCLKYNLEYYFVDGLYGDTIILVRPSGRIFNIPTTDEVKKNSEFHTNFSTCLEIHNIFKSIICELNIPYVECSSDEKSMYVL